MSSSARRNKSDGPSRPVDQSQACNIIGRYDGAQDVHVFFDEANPLAWIETPDEPINLEEWQ